MAKKEKSRLDDIDILSGVSVIVSIISIALWVAAIWHHSQDNCDTVCSVVVASIILPTLPLQLISLVIAIIIGKSGLKGKKKHNYKFRIFGLTLAIITFGVFTFIMIPILTIR